jgi:DNA-binding SARP family transcriptional activator
VRVQPAVRTRLFGDFRACVNGTEVPSLGSARLESLLAYLLLHPDGPQTRQRVASALWPDSTEAQARTNLRHLLHTLRESLPGVERYVEITSRTLRWRPEVSVWLDVDAFDDLLAAARREADDEVRRARLREAVELYTGDLLDACSDEWLVGERDRLRRCHLDALGELARLCEKCGDLPGAITYAERLLRGDEIREDVHRQLMRLHAARGDRAAALRVFHRCSTVLERELGVQPSAPTRATYEALLVLPGASAGPVARGGGLVGRAAEWARLAATWRSAAAGHAQLALVTGEAGIGKSRLVEELRTECTRTGGIAAEARCYPAEGPLAYGPVVDWLRCENVRARLPRLRRTHLTELARLLPELLVAVPGLPPPLTLPESEQRHRLFEAVTVALLAPGSPVLLVVDDVPHADRETCQLLHYLLRSSGARLLVVATARSEDLDARNPVHELLAGLRDRGRLIEIELPRLGRDETALLAERLTGRRLGAPQRRRLYQETEGNPLFVVETLRAGWPARGSLSPRLQSVIESRFAQLSDRARGVLEVAAVIGREFPTDVLAAAGSAAQDELVSGLDELWRRRIVREHGLTYAFSHDKIRQVAYAVITPPRRRLLHGRVAAALERVSAADPGPVSARIAVHHEQAGAVEQAIVWYRTAADAAQLLHANRRAVRLLERALELLGSLPGSADRDRLELELRTALLAPLVPLHGYLSPAMGAAQQRARELTALLGAVAAPPLLRSLALGALTRGDFPEAVRCGDLLRAAGEALGDDVLVVEGAYVLGIASFWQADLHPARRYFELAVAHYRARDRMAHLLRYGQDPKVVCLGRLANTLWFLGSVEPARAARDAAISWADEINHPFSTCVALTFGALLAVDMGDEPGARGYIARLVTLGTEGMNAHVTRAFRGYVATLDGDAEAGPAEIRAALAHAARSPTAPGQHAMLQRLLLAACRTAGDHAAALAAADRLLAMGGPARLWAPVARRARAELAGSV